MCIRDRFMSSFYRVAPHIVLKQIACRSGIIVKQSVLTNGNTFKVLIKFSLPFLLANILQALYGAADLFMVGRFADSAAVSAVAVGGQVMQTITGLILSLIHIQMCIRDRIYRCRQELNRLTAENEPLTSDRMVKLTNRLTDHCLKSHIMSSKNA